MLERSEPPPGTAAAFAAALGAADEHARTPAVLAKVKLCLLDYLASAFTARDLPWSRAALAVAEGSRKARAASGAVDGDSAVAEAHWGASVIGTAMRASAADAAFANAVRGHGLVRDDMHLGSVSHLGVVVVSPALALAEIAGASGHDLTAALVAGYEAGAKIGRAILDVDVARVFRPTGITGPIAGAAAGARILGLGDAERQAALVLAANTSAGYNEWAATGGSEMFFHPGFAARNAIACLGLAAAGAFASPTGLEGRAGLLAAFGKAGRPIALPFERTPEILEVFFKEVPACNFAQAPAQAARALAVEHEVDPAEITAVTVRVSRAAAAYPGCDAPGPFTRVLQAKMSIHYNVAAALVTRSFDEASYEPARNPGIAALARRVTLEVDEALTESFPARQGAEVHASLASGARFSASVADVAPASESLVEERFTNAAEAALGTARARTLAEFVATLETQAHAGRLARLAAPADTQPRS